jgi:membrane-associated phospholipid phosphatase
MPSTSLDAQRPSWRTLLKATFWLFVVAELIAALLAVLGLAVVGRRGGGPIQSWDGSVGRWFLHERDGFVGISKVIAYLGDAPVLALITIAATVTLLALGLRVRAMIPLVAYLGGEFFVFLTRTYIHRPRPTTANYPTPGGIPGVHETSASFPSAHSTAAAAVLVSLAGLAVITWKVWWPWIVGGVLSALVAFSRLVLGVHWFSDVTFGLLAGVAWGIAVLYLLAGRNSPSAGPATRSERALTFDRSAAPGQF